MLKSVNVNDSCYLIFYVDSYLFELSFGEITLTNAVKTHTQSSLGGSAKMIALM